MSRRASGKSKRRTGDSGTPDALWLLTAHRGVAHLVLLATRLANAPSIPWRQFHAFGCYTLGMLAT